MFTEVWMSGAVVHSSGSICRADITAHPAHPAEYLLCSLALGLFFKHSLTLQYYKTTFSWITTSLFAGNYRTQLYNKQTEEYLPATQGLGMFVEVKDPDDKVNVVAGTSRGIQGCRCLQDLTTVSILFPTGDSVPSVWLRGKVHLHVTHTWRTSDLPALKFLQVRPVCWRHAGEEALGVTDRFHTIRNSQPKVFPQECSGPSAAP